jgi:acyl-CoA synthetase (AMP-forming)/AMP-acid ligase II
MKALWDITRKCSAVRLIQRPFSRHIVKSPLSLPELQSEMVERTPLPLFVMKDFLADNKRNEIALIDGHTDQSLTYAETYNFSYQLAAQLKDIGISRNDTVAMILPNHLYYFSIFMAIALRSAISSSINPLYSESEIAYQLSALQSKAVFVHFSCLEKTLQAVTGLLKNGGALEQAGLKSVRIIVVESVGDSAVNPVNRGKLMKNENIQIFFLNDLMKDSNLKQESHNSASINAHSNELLSRHDPHSVVTMPFSSGTTGRSKGVMLTHKNLISNILQGCQIEPKSTVVFPLPFFHIYGFAIGLMISHALGSKVIFLSTFELSLYLKIIEKYRVNRAYAVPPIILGLTKQPVVDNYDLSSLKVIISGAASLGVELQQACSKRLKGLMIKQLWGMTELSPLGTISPDSMIDGNGDNNNSSGTLMAGTEARIIDPVTGEDLPATTEGELLIKGPQVMKGYFNNPTATAETITSDGWLHTGDIACFDEEGRLHIRDRLKELIKYKGFQIAPADLEAIILGMKEVKDVIVIPVKDEEVGEIPRAYVVKQADCPSEFKEDDIIKYVHQHVSPQKRLRGGVRFTDAIPKSPSGKLLRRVQIEIDRKSV